jgi:hypothetical protein
VPQTNDSNGNRVACHQLYMFYRQLRFLLPHVKGNTSTSSNIGAPAGTQNDAESSQDTPDQTAYSTAGDCRIGTDATASPTAGSDVALSLRKRTRKNLHKHGRKRAANEHSIASLAMELTSISTESLAIQKEQEY